MSFMTQSEEKIMKHTTILQNTKDSYIHQILCITIIKNTQTKKFIQVRELTSSFIKLCQLVQAFGLNYREFIADTDVLNPFLDKIISFEIDEKNSISKNR